MIRPSFTGSFLSHVKGSPHPGAETGMVRKEHLQLLHPTIFIFYKSSQFLLYFP
jgi:hypothetical protein